MINLFIILSIILIYIDLKLEIRDIKRAIILLRMSNLTIQIKDNERKRKKND